MALKIEKAQQVLRAIDVAGLLEELNYQRMLEIFRRLRVSSSVMTEALITAGVIKRVKRGQYELEVYPAGAPLSREQKLVEVANDLYKLNAEAERARVAKKTGAAKAGDDEITRAEPDPEPKPATIPLNRWPLLARVERLEKLVAEMSGVNDAATTGGETQLELVSG